MNSVHHIETLVSIQLASFKIHIESINLLNRPVVPSSLILAVKTLAETLLHSIESIERKFIADVEKESELVLGSLDSITRNFRIIRDETTGAEHFRQLTRSLDEEKKRLVRDIAGSFKKMKDSVTALIAQIEAI